LQWHVFHADVRRLALAGDAESLLARLDAVQVPPDDDIADERAVVLCALGALAGDDAVSRIARLLGPEQPTWLRRCAAEALERIGGPVAANAVVPALEDEHWAVQSAGARALKANPVPNAFPVLAAVATSDARALVRSNALEALGRGKAAQWTSLLETGARDESVIVMLGAANGLAHMESVAALEALQNVTRERSRLVRTVIMGKTAWSPRRHLRRVGSAPASP
jgi:HEAT repeat protein